MLRSSGRFAIRSFASETVEVALQIANNLFQYFGADSEILVNSEKPDPGIGNIITLVLGNDTMLSSPSFAIKIKPGKGLSITDAYGQEKLYRFEAGLGAIYLRPLPDERLELVVWGLDKPGLVLAARLVPMLTGVGQPDFVVVGKESAWKGAAGARAMGFFDHDWNISRASYLI